MKCRFGCPEATVRVELEAGCICFPHDTEQYLCEQHWVNMEPLGWAKVVEELAG